MITRDYASPEADIGPTLAVRGLSFGLEVWNGGGGRNRIEGHVNDGRNASRGCCLGSCCEALPIGAPRLVEVDMGTGNGIKTGTVSSMRVLRVRTLRDLEGYRDRHSR